MFRFIAYLQPTPKLKSQLTKFSIVSAGLICGYLKGYIVNQKYKNINDSKLTPYETEDQINTLIQKQKKPAVIYYGLSSYSHHSYFRQLMFKYSNLYPQNAIWTIVNIKEKFQQVKPAFDYKHKNNMLLQVRFPKSEVAIKVGQEGELMKINQKMHRREGFEYNISEQGFKKFLEQHRIIEGNDPIKTTLLITKNALFSPISQPQKPQQNKN